MENLAPLCIKNNCENDFVFISKKYKNFVQKKQFFGDYEFCRKVGTFWRYENFEHAALPYASGKFHVKETRMLKQSIKSDFVVSSKDSETSHTSLTSTIEADIFTALETSDYLFVRNI